MVKYACKVTSSECLSQSFTAVHEDIPKCMPEERLRSEPFKLSFCGFESRRASQDVSPVAWFVLRDIKGRYTEVRFRVRERFYSEIRYHSAKREKPRFFLGAMQKRALPENGYRVIPISAKRFLSALCRRHSNFQPLFLHEC